MKPAAPVGSPPRPLHIPYPQRFPEGKSAFGESGSRGGRDLPAVPRPVPGAEQPGAAGHGQGSNLLGERYAIDFVSVVIPVHDGEPNHDRLRAGSIRVSAGEEVRAEQPLEAFGNPVHRVGLHSGHHRAAARDPWLKHYNTERIPTGIGTTPITRGSPPY